MDEAHAVIQNRTALDYADIRQAVLRELEPKDQATVARISKDWSAEALDFLWRDLPSILPLFALLGNLAIRSKVWVSHASASSRCQMI